MTAILILHGPNLNLLGTREPDVYGAMMLSEIDEQLIALGATHAVEVKTYQSNHEGALIDALQDARHWASGVVFNPGGYTHTSVALRDALSGTGLPFVEVHLSNVHAREPFRHRSLLADKALAVVAGFGPDSYRLGLDGLVARLTR